MAEHPGKEFVLICSTCTENVFDRNECCERELLVSDFRAVSVVFVPMCFFVFLILQVSVFFPTCLQVFLIVLHIIPPLQLQSVPSASARPLFSFSQFLHRLNYNMSKLKHSLQHGSTTPC